jgi:hypothetical protein
MSVWSTASFDMRRPLPVCPDKQTAPVSIGMFQKCYSRKSSRRSARLNRRCSRQHKPDRRALTVVASEMNQPAQPVGDDTVGDVQAEPDAALMTTRGEERIESLTPDTRTHPTTIVGNDDFDILGSGLVNRDIDVACHAIRECVRNGVQEKACQHLPIWPGIAVHGHARLAVDVEYQIAFPQRRPETHKDLFGQIAGIEDTPVQVTLIDRDLLERLDQLCSAREIAGQLR